MLESIITRPEIMVPLGGCAVGAIAIICGTMAKMHCTSTEARLKERMIDQGMSPDDIQQVLNSSAGRRSRKDRPGKHSMAKPLPSK